MASPPRVLGFELRLEFIWDNYLVNEGWYVGNVAVFSHSIASLVYGNVSLSLAQTFEAMFDGGEVAPTIGRVLAQGGVLLVPNARGGRSRGFNQFPVEVDETFDVCRWVWLATMTNECSQF